MLTTSDLSRINFLSGSMLKLLAVMAMLLDHTALILGGELHLFTTPWFTLGGTTVTLYFVMRKIGRLAFPLFCFLITEGFSHTRSQKRYALQLLLFAFVSEVPFDLMLSGRMFDFSHQNIFFTLFFGVLLLYALQNVSNELLKTVAMFTVAAVATIANIDYGLKGVLLILLLHLLKNRPVSQALLAYPLLSGGIPALCAFVPINLYNGNRGFIRSKALKYAFYVFYPVHILVLLIIKWSLRS